MYIPISQTSQLILDIIFMNVYVKPDIEIKKSSQLTLCSLMSIGREELVGPDQSLN
jgi:hypothetical protein